MAELDSQLRAYSEWLAAEVERAAERSIDATIGIEPLESPRVRGRRWWQLVAVAASVVVIVAAILAVGAPDTEVPAIEPAQTSGPDPTSVPDHDDALTTVPTSAPVTSAPTQMPNGFERAPTGPPPVGGGASPWRDGFITFERSYNERSDNEPTPTLELTDEMAAVLPLDGFLRDRFYYELDSPYAKRPSVNDVVQWHANRGELDQLRADVADHPEVVAVIDAVSPSAAVWQARFTVDGDEWRTIDFNPPLGAFSILSVSGDLVVAVQASCCQSNFGSDPVMIAWTSDLVEWESMVVDPFVDSEALSSPHISSFTQSGYRLTVNGDRFILGADVVTQVNFAPLLPDEVFDAAENESHWEWNDTGTGIVFTVTTYDEVEGDGEQRFEYTYAELGMPSDPTFPSGEGKTAVVAGRLGDSSTVSEIAPPNGLWTFAAHGSFYQGGEPIWESADGTNWEPVPGVPDGKYFPVVELPSGTLFSAAEQLDQEPATMLFRDLSGQITTVARPPELPGSYDLNDMNGDFTFFVELVPDGSNDDSRDVWLVATLNGDDWFTLDLPDTVSSMALAHAFNGDRWLYWLDDGWEITRIPTE